MNTALTRVLRVPATILAVTGLAALGLAGCATTEPEASDAAIVQESAGFAISDAWIKATDTDMTGIFGTITNSTDTDFTIVSASTEIAEMTELHETIVQSDGSSLMQEMAGGITVPAGADYVLEPGGNHIMLMMLTEPILPGDEIAVTVTTDAGEEFEFIATAREYTGAQETYAPDSEHSGHEHGHADDGEADHGDADHGEADHETEHEHE